jgi:hypothetical protein
MDQLHNNLRKSGSQWRKWDGRDGFSRLRELGKALSRMLRNEGFALFSERLTDRDGQPCGYYLEAVQQAMADAE